ncbi:hypothetical protein KY317_02835, partial [Candidatus Woesearchaeota archaeon]|nr:hypothetical protein [Candidatus Woesearchaeota archaeon]
MGFKSGIWSKILFAVMIVAVMGLVGCKTKKSSSDKVPPIPTNDSPSVVIQSGPIGATTDNTPTFTYLGSDPDGTIAGYWVGIDDDPPTTWVTTTEWTSPVLTDGPHTFFVQAEDNEGAKSNTASRSFTINQDWIPTSTSPLSGRAEHTAVWTGTEMFVWGGCNSTSYFDDGAKYDPSTDTWTTMFISPLFSRAGAAAVWTGTEMIVWGGCDNSSFFSDGAKYDPSTDTWTMLSASPLSARGYHTAVWTGTEMIVWGGQAG